MSSNLNIIISLIAKEKLLELFKMHKEYSCVRFLCNSSCCGNPKIDILLDEIKKDDIIMQKDDIACAYDETLPSKIKEIQLIYEGSDFKLKIVPIEAINKKCNHSSEHSTNCTNCNKNCSKC